VSESTGVRSGADLSRIGATIDRACADLGVVVDRGQHTMPASAAELVDTDYLRWMTVVVGREYFRGWGDAAAAWTFRDLLAGTVVAHLAVAADAGLWTLTASSTPLAAADTSRMIVIDRPANGPNTTDVPAGVPA
jgi:hypothetical protein